MPTTQADRRDGLPSSEFVYRSLKEQIISGRLAPDTRLIELAIAAEFGVSRTPVREALKRLAAENLVLADPARGMIVHAPDAAEIEDVFVVREALDGLAARLAAHRITPSELGRLRVIVDSMDDAIAAGRREQVVIANQRFHDVIYAAAGNRMLERMAGPARVRPSLHHAAVRQPGASPARPGRAPGDRGRRPRRPRPRRRHERMASSMPQSRAAAREYVVRLPAAKSPPRHALG